jgi:hypothetical protein
MSEGWFNNLVFLSKGVQIGFLIVFIVIFLIFLRLTDIQKTQDKIVAQLGEFMTAEDFIDTWDQLYEEKSAGD